MKSLIKNQIKSKIGEINIINRVCKIIHLSFYRSWKNKHALYPVPIHPCINNHQSRQKRKSQFEEDYHTPSSPPFPPYDTPTVDAKNNTFAKKGGNKKKEANKPTKTRRQEERGRCQVGERQREGTERSEGPPLQRTIKGLILAAGVMYA